MDIKRVLQVLEPFARMHREGTDEKDLACIRGIASDMTILVNGDFGEAMDLFADLTVEDIFTGKRDGNHWSFTNYELEVIGSTNDQAGALAKELLAERKAKI